MFIDALTAGTSDPLDGDTYVASYADGKNATHNGTNTYHRRPISSLYNYMKSKLAVTNNNVSVNWNTETTIATIGGTAIKIKIPANPNTNTDTLVTQTGTSTDANYEVLFSYSANNTEETKTVRKNSNLTFNPSTGTMTTNTYKVTTNGAITYNSTNGCIEIIV